MPLLNSKHVNGSSYRKWHLTLGQQGVLYRLSNQLLSDLMDKPLEHYVMDVILYT